MHVAPSRALKSFTSFELMSVFSKEFWIDLRSDFTINSLRRYKSLLPLGTTFLVNDATLLLASKVQRFKDRIINAFAELLSDGKYVYQNFKEKFTLEGLVTTIWNITLEAYQNYHNRLFSLTFAQRLLTVFCVPTKTEREAWVEKEEIAKKMHFHRKITGANIAHKVKIPSKYLPIIRLIAQEFSYLTFNSIIACQDLIKGLLRAHASLNKRSEVCMDDVKVVLMVRPYLVNPQSPHEGLIVKYRAQGLSVRDIAKKIGKVNYNQQIQRVIKKAELRGVLDSQSLPNGNDSNILKRQVKH
jgi:hypothetical protein